MVLSAYFPIVVLPKGARNIRIRERSISSNYLAIRNIYGQYYLNGERRVAWPGIYTLGGASFQYKRPYNEPETLDSAGPLGEDIILEVPACRLVTACNVSGCLTTCLSGHSLCCVWLVIACATSVWLSACLVIARCAASGWLFTCLSGHSLCYVSLALAIACADVWLTPPVCLAIACAALAGSACLAGHSLYYV